MFITTAGFFKTTGAAQIKKFFKKSLLCVTFLVLGNIEQTVAQQNVGIGTSTPDNSAVLELSTQMLSSPKGFLVPRLTTSIRNQIPDPATGLLIFNSTTNQFEYNAGTSSSPTWLALLAGNAVGTVSSVGLSLPSIFTIDDSPITSSGTLTATLNNQPVNSLFAGPIAGSAAPPTFRSLEPQDIPDLDAAKIAAGTLSVSRGGTGSGNLSGLVVGNGIEAFTDRSIAGTPNQISITNGDGISGDPTLSLATNTALPGDASSTGSFTAGAGLIVPEGGAQVGGGLTIHSSNLLLQSGAQASELRFFEPTGGGVSFTSFRAPLLTSDLVYTLPSAQGNNGTVLSNDGNGNLSWSNSSGTVTSVSLSLPSIFNVTGSNVSSSGTLTAALASQSPNTVFAAPTGATGIPSFRTLESSDIPSFDASKIATGISSVSRGGTGLGIIPANGQILVGNGSGYALATITGTTNQVNISNDITSITFSLPQNIATTPSPTFTGLRLESFTSVGVVKNDVQGVFYSGSVNLNATPAEVSGVLRIANGGTNSSSVPIAGGVAYGTGAAYEITPAGTAHQILVSNGASAPSWGPKIIRTTINADIPQVANGSTSTFTFSVPGAATTSSVIVTPSTDLTSGNRYLVINYARVSSANTVEIRLSNNSGGNVNPSSMDFYITVFD